MPATNEPSASPTSTAAAKTNRKNRRRPASTSPRVNRGLLRSQARAMALQVLFETDLTGHEPREALAHAFASELAPDDDDDGLAVDVAPEIPAEVREYTERLVHGVLVNVYRIDPILTEAAPAFTGEQTPLVDRNVLRMALYELLHQPDVPPKVVINEAIELAKHFGGEGSGKFVNGVLGAVYSRLQRCTAETGTGADAGLEPAVGG